MTVAVGVDGSARSRAALQLAAQEARWRRTPLIAVGAHELPLSTPASGYPAASLHTRAEERAMTESGLRGTVADELGDEAEQAEVRVSPGLAGHVIIEAARETGQDSTQGNGGEHIRGQPERDFPGIARRVRLIADCPRPSAQARSGVRTRRFTCVVGTTMPHRCLRHITRLCSSRRD